MITFLKPISSSSEGEWIEPPKPGNNAKLAIEDDADGSNRVVRDNFDFISCK